MSSGAEMLLTLTWAPEDWISDRPRERGSLTSQPLTPLTLAHSQAAGLPPHL